MTWALPTEAEPVVVVEGDCLEMVPVLRAAGVAAVVSDPPYGMDWDTNTARFSGGHNPARRWAERRSVRGR